MTKLKESKLYYRAFVCPVGAWSVEYEEWIFMRKTTKGMWIRPAWDLTDDHDKWVPDDTRFVSKTKLQALERLYHRKRAYVRHCQRRHNEAQRQLAIARDVLEETTGEELKDQLTRKKSIFEIEQEEEHL